MSLIVLYDEVGLQFVDAWYICDLPDIINERAIDKFSACNAYQSSVVTQLYCLVVVIYLLYCVCPLIVDDLLAIGSALMYL